MSNITNIRITAETREQAEQVIAYLHRISGGAVALTTPHKGRKGGYLAYGTVQVRDEGYLPVQQPAARGGE
jgi:hypothetical protein